MITVYVGPIDRLPQLVQRAPPFPFHEAHPRDFGKLIDELRDTSVAVKFWTNNPYIVCRCEVDEVLVLTPSGPKPLTAHPKFQKWKDEFSPGEMWTMFGEEW